jgi:hypothetical protein
MVLREMWCYFCFDIGSLSCVEGGEGSVMKGSDSVLFRRKMSFYFLRLACLGMAVHLTCKGRDFRSGVRKFGISGDQSTCGRYFPSEVGGRERRVSIFRTGI